MTNGRDVQVQLAWADQPEILVSDHAGRITATIHPGLSETQVSRACAELGEIGPPVLAAWRQAVGLSPGLAAS